MSKNFFHLLNVKLLLIAVCAAPAYATIDFKPIVDTNFTKGDHKINIEYKKEIQISQTLNGMEYEDFCKMGVMQGMMGATSTRQYIDTTLKGRYLKGITSNSEYKNEVRWFENNCPGY